MKTNGTKRSMIVGAVLLLTAGAWADPATQPAGATSADWPQFCGPNRDSVVPNSPKLLDAWPKDGPPLVWKSAWVPGWHQGGCGGPAVADGKVFVYATAKNPVGGGTLYKLVTPEVLDVAGWAADLPADLAKRLEEARTKKDRPGCNGWVWLEIKDPKEKEKELDAFLAKNPELDKYIKDFIATLKPEEAQKFGGVIRKRLCIPVAGRWADWEMNGVSWDGLVELSKLQGVGYPTLREWAGAWGKATGLPTLNDHLGMGGYFPGFFYAAWRQSFTRTDTLVCLDAETGKTVWKKDFPVDPDVQTKINFRGGTHSAVSYLGLCGTPTIADGRCYFGGLMGLYCLSAKDGSVVWQAKCSPAHTSVVVVNGTVYHCGTAYDAKTGKVLWTTPLWKDGWNGSDLAWGINTPPSYWKSGEKTYLIIGSGAGLIACLDLETGKELWTQKVRNYAGFGPANFAVRNGSDILVLDNVSYRMTPTSLEPLKTLEKTEKRSSFNPGVLFQDNYYAETSGGEGGATKLEGFCCWDARTGELRWSGPHNEMGFCGPPIAADGKLVSVIGVGGQNGYQYNNWKVTMYRASPQKYEQLGVFAPGLIPWTPLALAGGKLFVRTDLGISCYDLVQHGSFLDKTMVTRDKVTFVFKQTGGGLAAKDSPAGLKDILIATASGPAKPAAAVIDGDTIVVDTRDAPVPFKISYSGVDSLTAKDGTPLPAFGWDESRVLKPRTCFGNLIVLKCDRLIPQNGFWNGAATYAVTGAAVTNARIDAQANTVTLTTDKTFKPGETVTLVYPTFPVDQGEPPRETLTVSARDSSAAKLVKIDETTSGSWKGVYGVDGALIVGEAASTVKCAVVTPGGLAAGGGVDSGVWIKTTTDARALQKIDDAQGRMAGWWSSGWNDFKIDVEITDGKEHQLALYCLDWDKCAGGRAMSVEVWDPWRNVALLDKIEVKAFDKGKYLVFNIKGHVELRLLHTTFGGAEASAIFFDPPSGVL